MLEKEEVKRRAQRVNLRAQMRYRVRGVASEFANSVSHDLSVRGIGFDANNYIAPQTPLMLEIDVLSRVLHPIGKVAWCQPCPRSDRNSLGVEFLEIDPLEERFLKDYISMQTGTF